MRQFFSGIFLLFLLFLTFYATTAEWIPIIDDANLIIHEAGHPLFALFGETMGFLGGTILQLLLPLVFGFSFLRRADLFAALIMLWWFGQNLLGVGRYIADARAQALPLIGGEHDWAFLLGRFGVLEHDILIGTVVRGFGFFFMCAALGAGLFVLSKNREHPGRSH
jgi:hypothetical protein